MHKKVLNPTDGSETVQRTVASRFDAELVVDLRDWQRTDRQRAVSPARRRPLQKGDLEFGTGFVVAR